MSDYRIYVGTSAGKYFKEEIKNRGLDKIGVHVVSEILADVIVIPKEKNWFDIEGELFDWFKNCEIPEVKNGGFWGQFDCSTY